MSSAEREELVRLVQQVPDDALSQVLAEVRRHLRPARWPPAWFGIAAGGGTAVGARSEDLLDEGFGRQPAGT